MVNEFELKRVTPIWSHYLRENHSGKGSMEIIRAFQLNLSGELGKRIESYGRFGLTYISSVMIEYDLYRSALMKEIDRKVPAKELPEATYANDGQMYQATIKWYKTHGDWPFTWPWGQVYDHMESRGMINLTLDEKQQIRDKVEASTCRDLAEKKDEYEKRIRQECKKVAVQKYLLPTLTQ